MDKNIIKTTEILNYFLITDGNKLATRHKTESNGNRSWS